MLGFIVFQLQGQFNICKTLKANDKYWIKCNNSLGINLLLYMFSYFEILLLNLKIHDFVYSSYITSFHLEPDTSLL